MESSDFIKAALFEHRFWLRISADHARFLYMSFSPNEEKGIKKASSFIQIFDRLVSEVSKDLSIKDLTEVSKQALYYSQEIRNFVLNIQKKQLVKEINIRLSPTFLNHMINETEEYLRILKFLTQNQLPKLLNPIHYHLFWLLDSKVHAASVKCLLDNVETKLIDKSEEYMNNFSDYYLKAVEITGYMRTSLKRFPALDRFNYEVKDDILSFNKFLEELEHLTLNKELLGTLMPLMLNHMVREECYYLVKLAQSTGTEKPDCDPLKMD